jgi:hypothetical protein
LHVNCVIPEEPAPAFNAIPEAYFAQRFDGVAVPIDASQLKALRRELPRNLRREKRSR